VNAPGVNLSRERDPLRSRLSSAGVIVRRDGWVEAVAAVRPARLVQCMGGWCVQREKCAHYLAPRVPGHDPIERLCAPSLDEPLRGVA
jgi:hypothetical protein